MGVAAGTMVCADGDTETPSYTATPEGKRIAERVLGLDRR
jgi:hypothetical protein